MKSLWSLRLLSDLSVADSPRFQASQSKGGLAENAENLTNMTYMTPYDLYDRFVS
jgi:hypothetical protein